MQLNLFKVIIGMILGFAIVLAVTGEIQWGVLASLFIGVAGFKWIRIKKQEANDEIEFDERVNNNIKKYSFQAFSICNLLLLVYLLFSSQILKADQISVNYLILYLSTTFVLAFYIVPILASKK